jgi:hypothetical protein
MDLAWLEERLRMMQDPVAFEAHTAAVLAKAQAIQKDEQDIAKSGQEFVYKPRTDLDEKSPPLWRLLDLIFTHATVANFVPSTKDKSWVGYHVTRRRLESGGFPSPLQGWSPRIKVDKMSGSHWQYELDPSEVLFYYLKDSQKLYAYCEVNGFDYTFKDGEQYPMTKELVHDMQQAIATQKSVGLIAAKKST